MPKEIQAASVAATVTPTAITYAWEPRGDPPAVTLVEIISVEYRDGNGKVVQTASIGLEQADWPQDKPQDRMDSRIAALRLSEGL